MLALLGRTWLLDRLITPLFEGFCWVSRFLWLRSSVRLWSFVLHYDSFLGNTALFELLLPNSIIYDKP